MAKKHLQKLAALLFAVTAILPSVGASASEAQNDSTILAYDALLDREPTQADLDYWSDVPTDTMLDAIIASDEFANNGINPVSATYNNILERQPNEAAWYYWTDMPNEDAVGGILDSQEVFTATGLNFELADPDTIDEMIVVAAEEFGVSSYILREIVRCESTFDPNALNPSNKEASGLTQQMSRYWAARTAAVGDPGADIFDPMANLRVGAWMLANEGTRPWLASRSCHGY